MEVFEGSTFHRSDNYTLRVTLVGEFWLVAARENWKDIYKMEPVNWAAIADERLLEPIVVREYPYHSSKIEKFMQEAIRERERGFGNRCGCAPKAQSVFEDDPDQDSMSFEEIDRIFGGEAMI